MQLNFNFHVLPNSWAGVTPFMELVYYLCFPEFCHHMHLRGFHNDVFSRAFDMLANLH